VIRETYKLSDLCTIDITDGTHQTHTYAETGVIFLSSKNVTSEKIDWDNVVYIPEELHHELYKRVSPQRDDILLAKNGTTGVAALVDRDEIFDIYVSLALLRPNKQIINPKYLLYAINNPSTKRYFDSHLKGIGVPNLHLTHIRETPIVVPSMILQTKIVAVLDKISNLIAMRKKQFQKLDDLVKSRFVEMFGDPIRNTQNRPTTDFINVVKMQRGFDLPVQDRQQDGDIPVFGSNGALDRHDVAKVQGGGVITGRSGTIGKVYYTEGDYWPLNTSLFSVDTHGNNIIYLAYLLQMYDLSRFTEGTGVPTLNRNKFHDKPIIDVPLNEQEQFAVFVKQTDKSKLTIQQSLDKLELMKKALMQKCFE